MPVLSNARHERFAQEIAKGTSSREAYKIAGYSTKNDATADACASRLLSEAKITARIEELQSRAANKAVLDRAWVIERLMRNARISLGEETLRVKRSKKNDAGEMEVTEADVTARDATAANKALELLGKLPELALFIDRSEVGKPGDFDRMSKDELTDFIRDEAAALGVGHLKAKAVAGSRKAGRQLN